MGLRADKLKRVPVSIENELAEHRCEPAHLYRVEEHIQSNDTQENRFLKYALNQISTRYETLKKRLEAIKNTSDTLKQEMLARNAEELEVGQYIVRYQTIISNHLNCSAFKKQMPDVYNSFIRQTTSKRFSIN